MVRVTIASQLPLHSSGGPQATFEKWDQDRDGTLIGSFLGVHAIP